MQGKLTASMQDTFRRKLTANVDRFDFAKADFIEIMDSMPVIIEQGQVTSPHSGGSMNGSPRRSMVISSAGREFDGEPQLQKLTNKAAFLSMRLREEGLTILTESERERTV